MAQKKAKKASGDSAKDREETRVKVRNAFNLLKADNKYIVYHKSEKQLANSKDKRTKDQIKADHVKFIHKTIESVNKRGKKKPSRKGLIGKHGRPKKPAAAAPQRRKDAFGLWIDT